MYLLPKWDELPNLDLYLDQVILYVNQTTYEKSAFTIKELTSSMINNYVKHGYLGKPIKKKYRRHQIARLIALTVLKKAFPIQEISYVLQKLQNDMTSEDLYNCFVDYWNTGNEIETPEIIIAACQTIKYYDKTMLLMSFIEKNEE